MGDSGLESWANLDAARHGGGQVWVPGAYDPETHLYITGTGNPTPAYTSQMRGPGDNLYTCALVAINVDTGKMQWYFQTSPHDTHDWDSTETPTIVDGVIDGKPRKLLLHASRNGYYFTLDCLTGEHIATSKYSIRSIGPRESITRRARARPGQGFRYCRFTGPRFANGGVTNWPPPVL